MSDCCDPISYRRFFNSKEASRKVESYRKKGLDPMASSMVGFLASSGLKGTDVLEVGGGVGAIQIELLEAGADRVTNIELSAGYEEAARDLAIQRGLDDRISRRLGDFVEEQDQMGSADIVIMNRVVCCYPWMDRMMEAAVSKAERFLALSFPRDRWWVKGALGIGNGYLAARRCSFRSFVHSPSEIEAVATRAGFTVRHTDQNRVWQALVLERAS